MIKIFSVDDQDSFLDSIARFFEPFPDQYDLVGRFGAVQDQEGVDDMLETIEETKPDIVLMDFGFQLVNRPDDFGIELTKRILKLLPTQKVVMLTYDSPFSDDQLLDRVRRSFQAGAIAYLRKDEPHTWLECIRETVKSGRPVQVIPETIIQKLIERVTKANTFNLTDREIEAISYLANDKRVADVGEMMDITHDGATFHTNNAKIKLEVKTLHGLVAKALRYGITI